MRAKSQSAGMVAARVASRIATNVRKCDTDVERGICCRIAALFADDVEKMRQSELPTSQDTFFSEPTDRSRTPQSLSSTSQFYSSNKDAAVVTARNPSSRSARNGERKTGRRAGERRKIIVDLGLVLLIG